ncbi:MAG: SIS domain-containing protein [Dehalococcoidales bacterium]|nr:SIS domain-containing protein [Dehalococcoidales bacterium]
MGHRTRNKIIEYISDLDALLERLPVEDIDRVVSLLEKTRNDRNHVFIFGNGGSAATASHFACDLAKGTISEGKQRIKAFALTDNVHLLTAWANDTSYDMVFAEQIINYVEPGDVVIAISGSGNSPNVLKGINVAREKGATTVGLIGFNGGKLKDLVDINVIAPIDNMERTEDMHLLFEHIISACLRES